MQPLLWIHGSWVTYVAPCPQRAHCAGDEWGEVDTRFSYCALLCTALLGRRHVLDLAAAARCAYERTVHGGRPTPREAQGACLPSSSALVWPSPLLRTAHSYKTRFFTVCTFSLLKPLVPGRPACCAASSRPAATLTAALVALQVRPLLPGHALSCTAMHCLVLLSVVCMQYVRTTLSDIPHSVLWSLCSIN